MTCGFKNVRAPLATYSHIWQSAQCHYSSMKENNDLDLQPLFYLITTQYDFLVLKLSHLSQGHSILSCYKSLRVGVISTGWMYSLSNFYSLCATCQPRKIIILEVETFRTCISVVFVCLFLLRKVLMRVFSYTQSSVLKTTWYLKTTKENFYLVNMLHLQI